MQAELTQWQKTAGKNMAKPSRRVRDRSVLESAVAFPDRKVTTDRTA
jgi:hypothetical protein